MKVSRIWYLKQFNLLKTLEKEELEILDQGPPMNRYKKGDLVMFPDADDPYISFLKKGTVKVGSYTEAGYEDLKYLVKEGHIFGELALVGKENPDEFAIAVEECLICRIEVPTMRLLMDRNPNLKDALLQLMGERINKLEKRLESILFKTSRTRIADFLIDYIREFGKKEDDGTIRVRNNLTFTDIARLTSTSRQTVNMMMSELRKEGILDYDREWIWLKGTSLREIKMLQDS